MVIPKTPLTKRAEAVRLIKSRAGCNSYTQGANRNYVFGKPEGAKKGYGDCSSTVRACILKASGIDIGSNTSAQIKNRHMGLMVEDNRDGKLTCPTLGKLQPGDCVYYKGTPSHTWGVGHVEMVTGDNECYGHGSGVGPTKKNLTTYSKRRTGSKKYLCTIRWITDEDAALSLGERPLTVGCKGTDVAALQERLIALGHDLGKTGVDGDYGTKTRSAVLAVQVAQGLTPTGIADIATISIICALASGETPPRPIERVKIHGGNCHIRVEPSARSESVGVAKDGAVFEASGETDEGWIGIVYQGKGRFVSSKYAEMIGRDEPVDEGTEDTPPVTPKSIVAVDLSQHNGLKNAKNDWAELAKNVEFVVLRAGVRRTNTSPIGIGKDAHFDYAAEQCMKHGIPFGVYFYGKSKSEADCRKEADKCYDVASKYDPLFYVYDVEEGVLTTKGIAAWIDQIRSRGAKKVGIYTINTYYQRHKSAMKKADFLWGARFCGAKNKHGKFVQSGVINEKQRPAFPCDLWQYTSIAQVPGIHDKTVDVNTLNGERGIGYFLGKH